MRVTLLDQENEDHWTRFVQAHGFLGYTFNLSWRDSLSEIGIGEPIYWLIFDNDVVIGILPTFLRKSPFGNIVSSLPYSQSEGGLRLIPSLTPSVRKMALDALIAELRGFIDEHDVALWIEVGSAFTEDRPLLFKESSFFELDRQICANNLDMKLEFDNERIKANLRKAERSKLVLFSGHDEGSKKRIYDVYYHAMSTIRVSPHSWEFFSNLSEDMVRFDGVIMGGEIVAAVILIQGGGVVNYYASGGTKEGRNAGATTWLCRILIERAKLEGNRWWKWMASPSKGVYEFKKGWGGEDRKYRITGWRFGELDALLDLSPQDLSRHFSSHFVLPFELLDSSR